MLHGRLVHLRPPRAADLDTLYAAHVEVANRGPFYPMGVQSESAFRRDFAEHGLWQREQGTFVILDADDRIVGHLEFFKPVGYWDALELAYQLYDHSVAGRGYTTEAVQLAVDFLFATKKFHRLQLVIVPENAASRRIADKLGFQLEGTVRGAFFNDGRNQDVLLYSLVRTDPRPWHP